MELLDEFYLHLKNGTDFRQMKLPHSNIHFVRAAIAYNVGVHLTNDQVEQLLYDEGLLPAKRYGIPRWFREKWLNED